MVTLMTPSEKRVLMSLVAVAWADGKVEGSESRVLEGLLAGFGASGDERTEILVERIAQMPLNQLAMMKLLVNQTVHAQGLHATQLLGTVFDGITRHTPEGYAFQQRAATAGFRTAVRERDEPFGDGEARAGFMIGIAITRRIEISAEGGNVPLLCQTG